jgi:hypothetical protein
MRVHLTRMPSDLAAVADISKTIRSKLFVHERHMYHSFIVTADFVRAKHPVSRVLTSKYSSRK